MSSLFDRILLSIYSIVVGICSFFLLFLCLRLIKHNVASNVLFDIQNLQWMNITVLIASIILIFISIRFLYVAIRARGGNPSSIDQRTDFGDIRISLETVQNLSLKAASRIRGAKDIKSRVQVNESGLEITIRALVDGETSIPELTEEMQRTIKAYIEEITGIPVASVSVYVANVLQTQQTFKSRVE